MVPSLTAFVPVSGLSQPRPFPCLTRSARHSRDASSARSRTAKRRRATVACLSDKNNGSADDWRDSEFVLDNSARDSDTPAAADRAQNFDWDAWAAACTPSEVPLLPFTPGEIFLPGESKRLHIYEARFLALFERAVVRYDKRFAHVLYAADRAALAAHGTLARIRHWRRLDVGVLVEIEGVGRLRVSALHRSTPFWAGAVAPVLDADADIGALREREDAALRAFRDVVRLCVRLGASPAREKSTGELPAPPPLAGDNGVFVLSDKAKREAWESRLRSAAARAAGGERFEWERALPDDVAARRARAVSFAAWDFFPSKPGERQRALEGRDTIARLDSVVAGLLDFGKSLAAKAAVEDALKG